MNTVQLTTHAAIRQQQRGIPPLIVDWLLSYGHREKSMGATKIRFDRKARKALARDVGGRTLSLMSKYLTVALVVDPETS